VALTPGAERVSQRHRRKVTVFMSMVRLARAPIVALPGEGFHITELDADGTEFNWLGAHGRIDIRSVSRRTQEVWLRVELGSVDSPREVELSSGGRTHTAIASRDVRAFRVGPFRVSSGQGTVFVSSTDPPRRYGSDPRRLSVRFGAIQAEAENTARP
jgi:hypothetical protein